jgi:GTP pyrophosphokinase
MIHTSDIHTHLEEILREIIQGYMAHGDTSEISRIQAAYEYAESAHKGILRKSGDNYIVHPVSAAQELMILQPDSTTIIATLLHDVVSHGHGSYEEIGALF